MGVVKEGKRGRSQERQANLARAGGHPLQLRGLQASSVAQLCAPNHIQLPNCSDQFQTLVVMLWAGLQAEEILPRVTHLETMATTNHTLTHFLSWCKTCHCECVAWLKGDPIQGDCCLSDVLHLRFEENFVRFSIVEFGLHIQRLHYLKLEELSETKLVHDSIGGVVGDLTDQNVCAKLLDLMV